jgi:predicted membrane channel-forming protein YqfA (hemolysin III family)
MLSSLVAAFVSGEALGVVRRARRAAIVYIFAAIALLTGLGFLIGAAYVAAARRFGAVEAAIAFGLAFIVMGLLALAIHAWAGRTRKREAVGRRSADLATIASVAAVSLLPTLLRGPSALRGKAGLAGILGPALAVFAYGIYRENVKPDDKRPVD